MKTSTPPQAIAGSRPKLTLHRAEPERLGAPMDRTPRDVLPFPVRRESKAAGLVAARVTRSPRVLHPVELALEEAQLRLDRLRLTVDEDDDRPRAA
jgi:hypothetical protein